MSSISDSFTLPPAPFPAYWNLVDLQQHLGGIPFERILLYPPPGLATEADALWLDDHEDRICELVDGILVEKTMSSFESFLAMTLGYYLNTYLDTHDLGLVLGADGQLWILPKKMRIPDVSFIRWDSLPGKKIPTDRVYKVAPDLAVEILSEGNTQKEMDNKIIEYFQAGTRLVWYIDPPTRTANIYTAPDKMTTIDENGVLDGGEVLPGFQLRLGELFERASRGR